MKTYAELHYSGDTVTIKIFNEKYDQIASEKFGIEEGAEIALFLESYGVEEEW